MKIIITDIRRKRVDYDITTLGLGMCKHTFQEGDGVRVEYVDPAHVVYSYTEDPYFKRLLLLGRVKNHSYYQRY